MVKEKNFNPVQAAKKAEKQKQLKKQKATLQAQRHEKLARRNPARIQRDIDSLKARSESGDIRPHERQKLSELEKDLAAVNKARAALGDKAPQFREHRNDGDERRGRGRVQRGRGGAVLGKRAHDGSLKMQDWESSDTDADVKDIPMPRDTPPPIPRRRNHRGAHVEEEAVPEPKKPTLVYEAAPQVRDLRKEAARFVPVAVAQKMKAAKGEGGLLEEDDFDRLEREGYLKTTKSGDAEGGSANTSKPDEVEDPELEEFLRQQDDKSVADNAAQAAVEEAEYIMMAAEVKGEIKNLDSKGKVAEKSLHQVEIEEVEDKDA